MMVDCVPGDGGIMHDSYSIERPKTSKGRHRQIDGPTPTQDEPPNDHTSPPPPRPTTSRSSRPRTSHGRRPPDQRQIMQQHQNEHLRREQEQQQQQLQQPQQPQQQQPIAVSQVQHPHRQQVLQQHQQQQQQWHQQQPMPGPQQQKEEEVFPQYRPPSSIDEVPLRPKTSHGRRRSSVDMNHSPRGLMSPASYDAILPSPAIPRPSSSSLSRYAVLPSIGASTSRSSQQQPPPPSPPIMGLGERSVTMLQMNSNVQVMKLEDDADDDDSDDDEESSPSPRFRRSSYNSRRGSMQSQKDSIIEEVKGEEDDKNNSHTRDSDKEEPQIESHDNHNNTDDDHFSRPLMRENTLSIEPNESDNNVLLAVKLPDGQRVSRRFRPDETMGMVMHFAEVSSKLDLTGHEIVCDAPPKKVFCDLDVTVGESGLPTRTVLHIRYPEQ